MLFFQSLVAAATIAFGASSVFAAPVIIDSLPTVAVSVPELPKVVRADVVSSIPQIVASLTAEVTPLADKLESIATVNATIEILTPILDDLKTVINGAIEDVHALTGKPLNIILATVDGTATVTVAELAQVLGGLFNLVFGALGTVLKVAKSIGANDVVPLLAEVATLVVALLQAVLGLVGGIVGGLLVALAPTLGSLLDILSGLGVTQLLSGLGINL
ncbi:hypothetical protein BDW22DRAFT_1348465 [Trametopsis cervina]|nr:hypothetical protein BDW22DRAFT_1348465 [Trametopsis cervina]